MVLIYIVMYWIYIVALGGLSGYRMYNILRPIAPPIIVGDCGSASDQAAWASLTLADDVNTCAGLSSSCTSAIKGIDAECVGDCMATNFGFSDTCSPAFGNLAACGFNNCKLPCISGDPNKKSCVKCNE
jgi:hypothetical protein